MKDSPLRVVHLSRFQGGGAGRAAYQLHRGLLSLGLDSCFVVSTPSTDPTARTLGFGQAPLWRRLRRRLRQDLAPRTLRAATHGIDPFDAGDAPFGADILGKLPPHDVLHLHGIGGFVDAAALLANPKVTACVWTLHDESPFTGGCAYSRDCRGFTRECGRCPQLHSASPRDRSHQNWNRKRAALQRLGHRQLRIVATSHAMADACRKSSLLGEFPTCVIPYAIDTSSFCPHDRSQARAAWSLPDDRPVVLFAAHALDNPRKGGALLRAAFGQLTTKPDPVLLLVGEGEGASWSGVPAVQTGPLRDDARLALAYSAADIVVVPSEAEAFGLVALEAQACGTPVIGMDLGGLRDIIAHGRTGLLLTERTPVALAQALDELLQDDPRRLAMAAAARVRACEAFAPAVYVERMHELYRELVVEPKSAV